MAFKVSFYEKSTRKPVEDFLDSVSPKAKAKCLKYIQLFQEQGFSLPATHLEKVEKDLWALRPEYAGNEYRLFLSPIGKGHFALLHAAIKKGRRLSSCGLHIAQERRDAQQRERN